MQGPSLFLGSCMFYVSMSCSLSCVLSSAIGSLLDCRKTSFGSPRLSSLQLEIGSVLDVSNASLMRQESHADPVMQALTHSEGAYMQASFATGIAAGAAGEAG